MNSKTKQSKNLRTCQTSAEKIMWRRLRDRQLLDLKFRRQYIMGNFVVDFYCKEINLVLEIDGDVHGYREKRSRDELKESFLKERGVNMIRYPNNEIYDNLENVLQDLFVRCERIKEGMAVPPHPDPLLEGEGVDKDHSIR